MQAYITICIGLILFVSTNLFVMSVVHSSLISAPYKHGPVIYI